MLIFYTAKGMPVKYESAKVCQQNNIFINHTKIEIYYLQSGGSYSR